MTAQHVIVSKDALAAMYALDPSAAANIAESAVDIDLERADDDPSAEIQDVKNRIRAGMNPEKCATCGSMLSFVGPDDRRHQFTGHTDEMCRAVAHQRLASLVSMIKRDAIDIVRMKRTLGEMAAENRDAEEMFARASQALERAGVPEDVGNKDPLGQLAARVRWLASAGLGDAELDALERQARMVADEGSTAPCHLSPNTLLALVTRARRTP